MIMTLHNYLSHVAVKYPKLNNLILWTLICFDYYNSYEVKVPWMDAL